MRRSRSLRSSQPFSVWSYFFPTTHFSPFFAIESVIRFLDILPVMQPWPGANYTLPTGDRAANLFQAIACYLAALLIFQQVHAYYASVVKENVEVARNELQNLVLGEE